MVFDLDMIRKVYQTLPDRIDAARQILKRPFTQIAIYKTLGEVLIMCFSLLIE